MPDSLIGLALGGGVARGWAHIGAIHALERAGIRPNVVAGTSIGALVGGSYLAGHLDTLETWARSLSKRRLIGYLDVVVGGSGLLGGKRLERQMSEHMGHVRIEDLDIPYVAVAGELATGHEVWLEEGPLVDAITASYALPGVFNLQKRSGRWLVDGALVNPVPVSVCRAKGARMVIAVSLSADAFGKSSMIETERTIDALDREEGREWFWKNGRPRRPVNPNSMVRRQLFGHSKRGPGIGTVMLSSLNIVMDRLSRSRMAGDPPDVLVSPRCGHISLLDFHRADELIQLGEEAMEAQLPAIRETIDLLR